LSKLILDVIIVSVSFLLSYWVRFNISIIPAIKGVPSISEYVRVLPVVILVFIAVFKWCRFYEEHKIVYKTDEFLNIIKAVIIATVLIIAATFVYREYSYSRLVIVFSYMFNVLFLFLSHRLLRFFKIKLLVPVSGKIGILVIGGQKVRKALLKNISKHREFNVFFIPDVNLNTIKEYIYNKSVQEVIVADSSIDRKIILKLINFCEKMDIEFKMIPDMLELKMGEMTYDNYFGIPVLQLKHPLFEPSNYYFKRTFDIVLSMSTLVALAPALLFITLIVKIDSLGPAFYSQLRKGFKGIHFKFYKFRSMVNDADKRLKELINNNERGGPVFKMKNDPRVTKIGKFIRKYSIDEVPQLFNVLKGDMSLVGPRPQVLWEAEAYDEEAKRRLNVLPGVTGLWQVSGRSDLSYEEMIRLDLYYLENWSPGFDLKILCKTIPVVLLRKGAY
jgi:exopolysaccharide biosynthesis polyprenyl glycosylphosphotransferase